MTHTRHAYPAVIYNGSNITEYVDKYLESFQYTDPASGESDSLSLTLGNWDQIWLSGWFPDKGAVISANVHARHWIRQGDLLTLDCGLFTLDDISFSGIPDVLTMGAVSAPADNAFKGTERTKTWEDVTVRQIASDIAGRYGLTLVYDADTIKIAKVEQSKEADSSFLEKICKDYGISLKIYRHKLVLFDREKYKAKAAVATIDRGDMLNYTFNTTLDGTYTGGEFTFTTDKGKEVKASIGSGPRILKANVSASTTAEAKQKLISAVEEANHSETTLSFSTIGNTSLVSGQCINITGLGIADGKYYIDKATHSVGTAYTTAFECSRVREVPLGNFSTSDASSSSGSSRKSKLDTLTWATRTQAEIANK